MRRTRTARHHRTQQVSEHVEYLIPSLPRTHVSLEPIAHLRRRHWTIVKRAQGAIENVTHSPREVSFGEDRCQVHSGSAPQALAALRKAVVGTLRLEGWPHLPNGFRYCRTHLQTTLRWLGAPAT